MGGSQQPAGFAGLPRWLRWLAVLAVCGTAVGLALRKGCEDAATPARCPKGTVDAKVRCCLLGQRKEGGQCVGKALSCPEGFRVAGDGCAVVPRKVMVQAGQLTLGPGDWEAQGVVVPREVVVDEPFGIDVTEVTVLQWQACVSAGACDGAEGDRELGRPVRGITFAQAQAYCRWAGGQLPREDQWLLAASGAGARRYPWGDTGAVCRRACWGVWNGPCAVGGSGPDLAGLAEGDRTPSGVQGMAGGVAEWVVTTTGGAATRGGSWRSRLATELRTWRQIERPAQGAFDDVGVRCVYASPVRPTGAP